MLFDHSGTVAFCQFVTSILWDVYLRMDQVWISRHVTGWGNEMVTDVPDI